MKDKSPIYAHVYREGNAVGCTFTRGRSSKAQVYWCNMTQKERIDISCDLVHMGEFFMRFAKQAAEGVKSGLTTKGGK